MTNTPFLAAAIQLHSTEDVLRNVAAAEDQVRRAAARGARLVTLPENFAFLRIHKDTPQPRIGLDHAIVVGMCELARSLGVDLVLGSIPEPSDDAVKTYNSSVYIDALGGIRAVYRKMHLFDIDLPGQVSLRESDTMLRGTTPTLIDAGLGLVGLSICYDLRFPELYRRLTAEGARVLLVPAAFTLQTGKDHWQVLLRARAIENQCYVIAAAQYGHHGGTRYSYGKALIADPWGLVLATSPDGLGFALAEIDYAKQDEIRRGLPCASHRNPALG